MPDVEQFMDSVVADLRQRLALLDDDGDRRAIEDGIALLTEERRRSLDAPLFEHLLAGLRAGMTPTGSPVLRPEFIGRELSRRWAEHTIRSAAVN